MPCKPDDTKFKHSLHMTIAVCGMSNTNTQVLSSVTDNYTNCINGKDRIISMKECGRTGIQTHDPSIAVHQCDSCCTQVIVPGHTAQYNYSSPLEVCKIPAVVEQYAAYLCYLQGKYADHLVKSYE